MAEIFDDDLHEYLTEIDDDKDNSFDGDYELADRQYEESRDKAAEEYLDSLDH